MKPSNALNLYREQIRGLVEIHHAKNPRVFGSVLYELDEDGSDLDILIEPTQQTTFLI